MDELAIFTHALDLENSQERAAFLEQACGANQPLRARVEALLQSDRAAGSFLQGSPPGLCPTDVPIPLECPGTQIGPYKLLEQIGEGGMGLVYMAEQQQPVRRLVALKIIKPGMDSKQVIARFEAERQALAMMDHPNIAKIFDAGTTGQNTKSEARNSKQAQSTKGKAQNEEAVPLSGIGASDLKSVSDFELRASNLTDGRPYFVMELVRGIPINEFCEQKRLTICERLQLFIQVCQAVQHAHQKGIIHRDLKPTNVLVTMADTVAFPKVIDFGIAKALGGTLARSASEGYSVHTGFAQLVGTPLYMSPEQAEMNLLGVDTRSDVYSLGVLLYELLTGTTPFDKDRLKNAGFDEMRRIIREEEPETVSARIARTRRTGSHETPLPPGEGGRRPGEGASPVPSPAPQPPRRSELDWIVMKSLDKDRTRRYESASAFAADIQRYLSDEPVLACPPTAMYRFQKFARKHKPTLATAAAIAACLVLGTTVSAWQAVRATAAEAQANANEAQAKASAKEAKEKAQEATAQRDEAQKQRDEVRALNEKLQRTLYAAHMTLAKHAWDEAAVPRVLELLEQHRPKAGETDPRGFEWHYLYRLCHSELLTLKGGQECVAYSPDGRRLAGGSQGNTVKVWDAQTGHELLSLKGHTDWVRSVAFSPDGKQLASASGDNTVKVWDAQTGRELLTFKGHSEVVISVAYSPDGRRLASADENGAEKVWDAQTGQELLSLKGHNVGVMSVAFSPDGKRLASADWDGTVKVWDGEAGRELLTLKGAGWFAAFSPDGKRLATADGYEDHKVKLWDVQTGQQLLGFSAHSGMQVNAVAFSPDGRRLASVGGDRTVKIWNSESGEELITFKGHTNMAWSVAFSPDGTRLASAAREGMDGLDGTVRVWDATTSPGAPTVIGLTSAVTSMAFSPDGKRRAVGTGTWDDNRRAYTAGELKVFDAQTSQELFNIKGLARNVLSAVFSPDGKRLAATDDKTVKVWDAQTGRELLSFQGHGNRVTTVVFSPDGKRLASVDARSIDGYRTVKVWDAQSGQEHFTLNGASVVAFSSDGKRLVGIGGRAVKLWDAQTGQELPSFQGGNGISPFPPESGNGMVAVSPDGKRLARGRNVSGIAGAGEVQVLDAQTGQELLSLKGHTALVSSVDFSPDGKRLASGSGSGAGTGLGEVKVWDTETGHELLNLRVGGVGRVDFSPDGHWLLINDASGTLKIFDATPLPERP